MKKRGTTVNRRTDPHKIEQRLKERSNKLPLPCLIPPAEETGESDVLIAGCGLKHTPPKSPSDSP